MGKTKVIDIVLYKLIYDDEYYDVDSFWICENWEDGMRKGEDDAAKEGIPIKWITHTKNNGKTKRIVSSDKDPKYVIVEEERINLLKEFCEFTS